MKNNISIVIPCKDDKKILDLLATIDADFAEIVIVFNGSTNEFIKEVKNSFINYKNKISCYILPKSNLALALEYGTRKSKNDLILYMDSDCRFKNGAIRQFLSISNLHDPSQAVFKGTVVFERGLNYIEKIIAVSREHHTAEVLTAYKPPLLISKKIIKKIGGYVFNEKLIWREDADLDNRIRENNIEIIPVSKGIIYHHKISLKTDLRSTFRYGIGLAIADAMRIKLTEVPRSTLSAFKSKGLIVALYMLFRNRIYNAGYLFARIKILFGYYV